MAQFDVYENTNRVTIKQYPLIVDIQHSVLSSLATRIVIPLSHKDSLHGAVMDVLMPEILFDERCFVLMTPQISAVPDRLLSKPIGTLEHCRSQVLAALDFAITGI
jgi:toxin CcdB